MLFYLVVNKKNRPERKGEATLKNIFIKYFLL